MSQRGSEPYPIVCVPDDVMRQDEALGSKPKFWYGTPDGEGGRPGLLFKRTRPNEDWSEKVAAELAAVLGLPHARYELATYRGVVGVVSHSLIRSGEQLVHGNEVLHRRDETYRRETVRGAHEYTVERAFAAVGDVPAPEAPDGRAPSLFAGYLLLDAWIGNTDRHHQNWGLVESPDGVRFAPTFDHATCLGRELTPEKARRRLDTRDPRQAVGAYLDRARSAFYAPASGPTSKPISPVEAWQRAARLEPEAARHWQAVLRSLDDEDIALCLDRVPSGRIGDSHRALARRMLQLNRERIEHA